MEKIIGILGGMGPEATADFFRKIIKNTPAERDQDHPRIIIYNNPKIPDRTEYLVHKKESPLPELLESARKLEEWGADFITIPCNTAHFFFSEIQEVVGIPVVNMVELAADAVEAAGGSENTGGLLATEGTVKAGVYAKVFGNRGLNLLYPEEREQKTVTELIKAVKRGALSDHPEGIWKEKGETLCGSLTNRGASSVILGCTELPILFGKIDHPFSLIDPTELLAKEAVRLALS